MLFTGNDILPLIDQAVSGYADNAFEIPIAGKTSADITLFEQPIQKYNQSEYPELYIVKIMSLF